MSEPESGPQPRCDLPGGAVVTLADERRVIDPGAVAGRSGNGTRR